jgi:hypothetical protein
MTPSLEEIKAGREAFRLIEAYKKRRQRSTRAYLRDTLLALLFAYGLFALGAGWVALGAIPLWLFPRILTDYLLSRRCKKDLATLEDLRKKYGAAIDSELEVEKSAKGDKK